MMACTYNNFKQLIYIFKILNTNTFINVYLRGLQICQKTWPIYSPLNGVKGNNKNENRLNLLKNYKYLCLAYISR